MIRRKELPPELLELLPLRLSECIEPLAVWDGDVRLGPSGTSAVLTSGLQHVLLFGPKMVERAEILLIDGGSGSGKSGTLRVLASSLPGRSVTVGVRRTWTPNQFLEQMLRMIDPAADIPTKGYLILSKIVDRLIDSDITVIVDDAHRLNLTYMEALVSMWEECEHVPMVIAGINVEPVVDSSAELTTRIDERVKLRPAQGAELMASLCAYHPLFAGLTTEQVLRTDFCLEHSPYGAGTWRSWGKLLIKLYDRVNPDAPVTDADLQIALKRMTAMPQQDRWQSW